MKPTILVLLGYYLPGYKAGGVLRSIANLVDHLQDDFDFRIVTRDRDLGDAAAYPGITPDRWAGHGAAQVFHAGPKMFSNRNIAALVRETPHDLLYLNSFMQPCLSSYPLLERRLGRIPERPTIVAPRGGFSSGALALGRGRKRLYIALTRAAGLWRDLLWQASSEYEAEDIRRVMGGTTDRIRIACDPPRRIPPSVGGARGRGVPLRLLFLSRIAPMKNLTFALDVLRRVRAPVRFSIYGPVEDQAYWEECRRRIGLLPPNVEAVYHGSVEPDAVLETLRSHDLFFLPSLGENFGHVVAEAISVGTPVLLSQETPWRGLEARGIGRDISLSDPSAFASYIEAVARCPPKEYQQLCQRVLRHRDLAGQRAVEDHRALFGEALGG